MIEAWAWHVQTQHKAEIRKLHKGGSKNTTQRTGDIWFKLQIESDISLGGQDGKNYSWQTKQFNSRWKTGKSTRSERVSIHGVRIQRSDVGAAWRWDQQRELGPG